MSALDQHAHDYLRLRQALGHKMAHAVRLLPSLVAYLEDQGLSTVTTAAALTWAEATPRDPAPVARRQRLSVARGFARYMSGLATDTEIPPPHLLAYRYERRTPFIYSMADVTALMDAARRTLRGSFRGTTVATLIGLLAVTGLRVGEARRLTLEDVDGVGDCLVVHATKFGKSRELVLAPSVMTALRTYQALRAQVGADTPRLFITDRGYPLPYAHVKRAFPRLLRVSGVGAGASRRPRLHDLRHAFAVRTLIRWYHEGVNVESWLPRLSTDLGHTDPRDTYWYLSAVPELLTLAAHRVAAWQARTDR